MADEMKKLNINASNGSFSFPVVDQTARNAAQAAQTAAEEAKNEAESALDTAQSAKQVAEGITIPAALPNPNKLTFTGGATGTYDGSQPVTINIPTGGEGGGPIQYIQSLDESNLANLRDLATGTYVLYGYFYPYAGAADTLTCDNTLVSVAHLSAGSHVLVFNPLNCKVNFVEILVDESAEGGHTYSVQLIDMRDLNALIAMVGSLDNLTTEEKGTLVGAINEVAANAGSGGASAYELPIGGEQLGGVKNGGNVSINPDGTMTAPVQDSSQNGDQTIETVLAPDEVCIGRYAKGVLDPTYNRAICTRGYIKPFVASATLTSADYQFAVAVYNNGAYVRTDGWLASGTVYKFDHEAYQYKMYFGRVDSEYVNDLDRCRQSVKLTISVADILKSYNALEIKSDTERRNTKNAVEYMMRRNYDISYANAPAPLNLISYVGNNQIVHPKVLYFPDRFGGHKFWMAYTPYPFANDRYENPCIAYSDDGYEWTNIPGNPLFDAAGSGFCSDTHLVYVETTGKLEVWYRYANYGLTPIPEIMYRQTSADGVNWTEKEVVVNNTSGDYVRYLSPAVIHDGSIYKLWAVNNTENTINYYESEASTTGETIALDDAMTVGAVYTSGKVDATKTDYMYTEKIKLNTEKTFQLTAKNLSGYTVHPALRYVTAYDADGNVLPDHSLQSVPEATDSSGRTLTMDASVDSVIISIYKATDYTEKTIVLPAVESSGEFARVSDITLDYRDGETVYNPWHIDVIEDNGKTVLLTMCKSGTEWSLFLATSEDNITFTTPELVMVGNPYGWDNQLYRSSIVNVDGEYRIYYSAQDVKQRHGLGICTSNTLSNFVGKW